MCTSIMSPTVASFPPPLRLPSMVRLATRAGPSVHASDAFHVDDATTAYKPARAACRMTVPVRDPPTYVRSGSSTTVSVTCGDQKMRVFVHEVGSVGLHIVVRLNKIAWVGHSDACGATAMQT